jgi:hypothetical protein
MGPSYILMRKVRRYWLFTSSNLLEELAHDQVPWGFSEGTSTTGRAVKDDHAPDVKEANFQKSIFRNPKKCPFPGGKVPFAFVKNFVQK